MAMEFRIDLVENAGASGGTGSPPAGQSLTAAEWKQLVKQFGEDMARQIAQQGKVGGQPVTVPEAKNPNLATIEKQIVPALAAAAPVVATALRSASLPPPPAVGMARFYHGGHDTDTGPRWLTPDLAYAEGYANKSGGRVHYVDIPEDSPHLAGRKAFDDSGTNVKAPYVSFEAPEDIARQLKPYESAAPTPSEYAANDKPLAVEVCSVKEEAAETLAEAIGDDILDAEAADPAVAGAMRKLKSIREQVAEERAYAKLTGQEEPVYDAIDPELERRRKELKPLNDTLKGGSRIAAQMGMGATGQALFGAADVTMGVLTGDPIQAAIGGIQLVGAAATLVAEAMDEARGVIEFFGSQVQDAARNDYWKMFDDRIEFASQTLGKIPVVGDALASALNLAAAPVREFHDVVESFVQRGKELSAFSPELAVANALADVRTLIADMHEADVLGPELARLTTAQTDLQMEFRSMLLPIKEWLVEKLADIMEMIVSGVQDANGYLNQLIAIGETIKDLLNDIFGSGHIADIPELLRRLPDRMTNAWEERTGGGRTIPTT